MEHERPPAFANSGSPVKPEIAAKAAPGAPPPCGLAEQPVPEQPLWQKAEPPMPGAPPSLGLAERQSLRRLPRSRGFTHYTGLLLAGLACCAALLTLAALVWAYFIYIRQGYIIGQGALPLIIFFGAIFLSSSLITVLGRGGAIFPALLFALLVNVASWLLSQLPVLPLGGLLLKLGLSLLSAAAGFTVTKLLILRRRR